MAGVAGPRVFLARGGLAGKTPSQVGARLQEGLVSTRASFLEDGPVAGTALSDYLFAWARKLEAKNDFQFGGAGKRDP